LRKSTLSVVIAVLAAIPLLVGSLAVPAGGQGSGRGPKDLYVIGGYDVAGESPVAFNYFDDGAKLAVKDLERQGYNVRYERIPSSATLASSAEQAFLTASSRNPDVYISLPAGNVLIPVGPKVAATDLPFFALSSPTEAVKTGPSGGDNIFLLRPLNEQSYTKLLQFVCTDLKRQQKLKDVKIALAVVNAPIGFVTEQTVKQQIPDYNNCDVVTTQTNAVTATDLTQQALAIKNSGANVVVVGNFPAPLGVLVNQLRQNGVTIPVVSTTSLDIAVTTSGSITNYDNLWNMDDCAPEVDKDKKAKKFVKDFNAEFGVTPNFLSALVYDAFFISAKAVEKVGHDPVKINREIAATNYDGVCDYTNDRNNVLSQSVTMYKYKSPSDKTKVLVKKYPIEFIPNEELATATTAAPAAPATTASPR
jgi:ABC-type branched-subunit amino acid transport system substrate-binding protein